MDEQLRQDFEAAIKTVSACATLDDDNSSRILSALIIRQGLLEVAKSNEKVAKSNEKIAEAIDGVRRNMR